MEQRLGLSGLPPRADSSLGPFSRKEGRKTQPPSDEDSLGVFPPEQRSHSLSGKVKQILEIHKAKGSGRRSHESTARAGPPDASQQTHIQEALGTLSATHTAAEQRGLEQDT